MTLKLTRRYLDVLPALLHDIREASRQGLAITPVMTEHGVAHVLLYDLLELGLLRRTNAAKSKPQYSWVENSLPIDRLVREIIQAREARLKTGLGRLGIYERNRLDQRRCSRCGEKIGYGRVYLSRPTIGEPLAVCTECVIYFDQPAGERELNEYTTRLLTVGEHVYSQELETYQELLQLVAYRLQRAAERDKKLADYQKLAERVREIQRWLGDAHRIYNRHLRRCQELHGKLGSIHTVGDVVKLGERELTESLQHIEQTEDIQRELRQRGSIMQEALRYCATWLRQLGEELEARHLHKYYDKLQATTTTP
jgi:hypothetical protein